MGKVFRKHLTHLTHLTKILTYPLIVGIALTGVIVKGTLNGRSKAKQIMADFGKYTEKLNPEQVQALTALLTEKDIRSAAVKAGCGERTLYTWLEQPDFKAALHAAEAQLIDTAVRRLAGAAGDALDVLTTIMKNKRTAAGVRVRAATVVMEQLIKLRELNNLEERIAALEASKGENR